MLHCSAFRGSQRPSHCLQDRIDLGSPCSFTIIFHRKLHCAQHVGYGEMHSLLNTVGLRIEYLRGYLFYRIIAKEFLEFLPKKLTAVIENYSCQPWISSQPLCIKLLCQMIRRFLVQLRGFRPSRGVMHNCHRMHLFGDGLPWLLTLNFQSL